MRHMRWRNQGAPTRTLPGFWTAKRVSDALITAYRRTPTLGVYSHIPESAFRQPGEVASQFNWQERFLPTDIAAWRSLLLWAQCKANGDKISERISGLGAKRHTFEDQRRRAAQAIANGLNTENRNSAAFAANEQAEERLVDKGLIAFPSLPAVRIAS